MKIAVFKHYSCRIKNNLVKTTKSIGVLFHKTGNELINYLILINYYRSEIIIQVRVFKQNSRDINRFRKPYNF